MTEKIDVTERAIAAGWTLPEGFAVHAWAESDDEITDPRDWGDVYRTDVDEKDYDNPTHGFCRDCGQWLRKLDQAGVDAYRAANADLDQVVNVGDWSGTETGVACLTHGWHRLAEPVAVRWWRNDRWRFVTVFVSATDAEGREWGSANLGATESGTFPYKIDPDTGAIESREIDPVTDPDHPVPDLISEALAEAHAELGKYADPARIRIVRPSGD